MVSGGTAGGVQQQQGNTSRAFTVGRYLIPISTLITNYFNLLLKYKRKKWCLMMRKRKGRKERLNDKKQRTRFNLWVLLEEMNSNNEFW